MRRRARTDLCGGRSVRIVPTATRAGCVTQAAMNGANEWDIMRQTGHKSAETLARYIRIGQMFTHNAAASLGI